MDEGEEILSQRGNTIIADHSRVLSWTSYVYNLRKINAIEPADAFNLPGRSFSSVKLDYGDGSGALRAVSNLEI